MKKAKIFERKKKFLNVIRQLRIYSERHCFFISKWLWREELIIYEYCFHFDLDRRESRYCRSRSKIRSFFYNGLYMWLGNTFSNFFLWLADDIRQQMRRLATGVTIYVRHRAHFVITAVIFYGHILLIIWIRVDGYKFGALLKLFQFLLRY